MPVDAIIHHFRLFRSDDLFDPQWQDWSRCYEWTYALAVVASVKPRRLHNSGCGFEAFQRQFTDALDALVPEVLHTDLQRTPTFQGSPNFFQHDMRRPLPDPQTFAMVLAISYLEEIPPSWHPTVLANLWDQVEPGGRLLITCDVERQYGPSVSLPVLEAWLGATCERKAPLLTGLTSRLGARQDRPMHVCLIDLERVSCHS